MQAFISKHSYAVAFASFPYEHLQEEWRIINFILRKVVMMRELPLVKATKNLTFMKDIQTIDKQAKRLKQKTNLSLRQ